MHQCAGRRVESVRVIDAGELLPSGLDGVLEPQLPEDPLEPLRVGSVHQQIQIVLAVGGARDRLVALPMAIPHTFRVEGTTQSRRSTRERHPPASRAPLPRRRPIPRTFSASRHRIRGRPDRRRKRRDPGICAGGCPCQCSMCAPIGHTCSTAVGIRQNAMRAAFNWHRHDDVAALRRSHDGALATLALPWESGPEAGVDAARRHLRRARGHDGIARIGVGMTKAFQEPPSASAEGSLDLREFLQKVTRRKWLILGVVVLVASLAGAYSYSRPKVFSATATVLARPILVQSTDTDPLDNLSMPTEAQLVGSNGVARIARTLMGSTESTADLLKRVSVVDSGEHPDPPDLVQGLGRGDRAARRAGVRAGLPRVQGDPSADRDRARTRRRSRVRSTRSTRASWLWTARSRPPRRNHPSGRRRNPSASRWKRPGWGC